MTSPPLSWSDVPADLAGRVMGAFDASRHKVLATLRADGSPRVSGTELDLVAGELYLGSMPGARKVRDLQRDPRFALHSAPVDPDLAAVPDVKVAGRAVEVTAAEDLARYRAGRAGPVPEGPFHLFRLEVTEVVLTRVEGDQLVVESWHPGAGLRVTRRT